MTLKSIWLNLVLGIMLSATAWSDDAALAATLENARFDAKDDSITLDFVLKNHSHETIVIAERWNSWGAYQWTVNATTADQKSIVFRNPVCQWKKNFLSAVNIAPGKEMRLRCRLSAKPTHDREEGVEIFTVKKERRISHGQCA